MPLPTFKADGDRDTNGPLGADITHRPFLNLDNLDNYMVERFVMQDIAAHTTPALRTQATAEHGGNSAAGDPLYLIDESPLDPGLTQSGTARVSRLWAPEWAPVVQEITVNYPLPDLRGLVYEHSSGSNVVLTYDETRRRLEIENPAIAATVAADTTGGTFIYTGSGGSTAALAHDASGATLLAALQAVDPKVYTVTQKDYGIEVVRLYSTAAAVPDLSIDDSAFNVASLLPATASAFVSSNLLGGNFYRAQIKVTAGALTGGTWTYTTQDTLQTASPNWNDSEATILAALQAIDTNVDAVEIDNSGADDYIYIYYSEGINVAGNGTYASTSALAGGIDASGLTHSGSGIATTATASVTGDVQRWYIIAPIKTLTATAHALETGDLIRRTSGGADYAVTKIDDDNFSVAQDAENFTLDFSQYYRVVYWYVRSKTVPAQRIIDFYLPGVTAGIASAADIPLPAVIDHDYALLAAVAEGGGATTMQVGDLVQRWPGVYQRERIEINLNNLYDTE